MGVIRSGYTDLTPEDDCQMTDLLWPVVREMVKTAIENRQDMIIEGCYFPYDWKRDFETGYLRQIRMVWLIMTEKYIRNHFCDIKRYANVIERRLEDSGCCAKKLLRDNAACLDACRKQGESYILIDDSYLQEYEILKCIESQEERL